MSAVASENVVPVVEEALKVLQSNFTLWRAAFKLLDEPIEIADPKKPIIKVVLSSLSATLSNTIKSKDKWKGKDSKYYDYFGQLISGLDTLEKLVDKGVALDASGKAALPWAAIKLGLAVK